MGILMDQMSAKQQIRLGDVLNQGPGSPVAGCLPAREKLALLQNNLSVTINGHMGTL